MRNSTFRKFNLFKLFIVVSLFFITTQTRAQFPYSESFKNSTAPGILFGGSPTAFLTAGAGLRDGYDDPNGSGYLRLTNNQGNQKGVIYSDMYSFPSAYGMTISFEYYTHGGNGADGIAFVLFDATVTTIVPGAFGGSLGYAQRNSETGFPGGYLGIGIDEFGNFSANNEGKSGGVGVLQNNITLRGQGSGTTGYAHLTSVQTSTLATSPFNIAGGNRAATTTASTGFRKVSIKLTPRTGGGFIITVSTTNGNTTRTIINNFEYPTVSPPNLKFAITSSTGGSNNFHEIRNLDITVDQSTLLTPAANPDTLTGCIGLPATSGDITANDNGSVNTLGKVNKTTVDLDTAAPGIQTTNTVAGKGTFTYDATTGAVTFTPVDNTVTGSTSINYTFNDTYGKTSNASTITYTVITPITNNTLTAPAVTSFCESGDPANIVGSAAGGGTSAITYQWQSSSNNSSFSNIGVTTQSYDPPSLSATTYFRRIAISETCQNTSNVIAILVGKNVSNTTSTASICECATKTLSAAPAGGTWSVVSGGGTIAGNIYTPADVTADTAVTLRYTVNPNGSCTANSADVTFIVNSDNDRDGIIDSVDLDDDNDGILDTDECFSSELLTNTNFKDEGRDVNITTVPGWTLSNGNLYADALGIQFENNNTTQTLSQNITKFYPDVNGKKIINVGFFSATGNPVLNSESIQFTIRYNGVDYAQIQTVKETNNTPSPTATITYLNGATGNLPSSIPHFSRSGSPVVQNLQLAIPGTAPSSGTLAFFFNTMLPGNDNSSSSINDDDIFLVSASVGSCADFDNDNIPNFLDLDSDNDGCSDANEYYGNYNADGNISGNDNAMYGTGSPAVGSDGKVTGASYSGTYTNVINAGGTASTLGTANPVDRSVGSGLSTTFSVTATGGSGTTLHQWQLSTDGGTTWTNIANGGVYSNATTATLNLTGVTASMNGYKYRDLVYQSNKVCAVVYSRAANLCVMPATPTITSTAATCSAAGSSAVSNYDAALTYTFSPSGPAIGTGGAITGMSLNTDYTLTAANSTCSSNGSSIFRNNSILPTPTVPTVTVTAATCSAAGTSTISNYTSGVSYVFSPTGPNVAPSGLISGMTADTDYTVSARGSNNCSSAASSTFRNASMLPTPAVPTVTVTAATCSAAGTSTISNYTSGVTYVFSPTGPNVAPSGLISGMTADTDYTVSARGSNNCSSAASSTFRNASMLPTPAVPTVTVTAATCSAAGTSTISNYTSGVSYVFSPTGPNVAPSGLISGMTADTDYTVSARGSNNCSSAASSTFRNGSMLPTPAVPTVTVTAATCSAAGTSTISNYTSGVTYVFSPTGPNVATSGLISGMTADTDYTVSARGSNNCSSAASSTFRNASMLPTPAVPTVTVTAATCSAAGTSTISNYTSGVTYVFSPTGPNVAPSGLISGMTADTDYTVSARGSNNCSSAASSTFRNGSMLPTPAVPTVTVTAATCSAAGTSTISNYTAGVSYVFSPTGPNVAPSGLISGMTADTDYTVSARGSNNCSSAASSTFRNASMLPTPAVPTVTVTAATCSAAGTSTISNYTSGVSYVFSPTGPNVATSGLISGMTADTDYTVSARGSNNCSSAASSTFRNASMLPTPAVPTVTVTAATCSAAGTSTISNYTSGVTYVFSPTGPNVAPSGLISGMTADTDYTVSARGSNNCSSAASSTFRNASMLPTPAVPTVTVTAATCSAAGTSTISNYTSGVTYVFSPTGPNVAPSGLISGMTADTDYTVSARGSNNCSSAASSTFRNNSALPVPAKPTFSTVTQPTCSTSTGSFTITNYNPSYSYVITPSGATLNTSTGVVTGTNGTYTITATLNTCTSDVSDSVKINSILCANNDTAFAVQTSGSTAVTVGNVTSNDTLNGAAVTSANTNVTPKTTGPLSVDADGELTLAANTASGTYTITYEICEEGASPANCKTAAATVDVVNGLMANADNSFGAQTSGSTAVTVGNVTSNDTLNGAAVTSANTNVTPKTTGPLSVDADGELTLAANTASGTYTITYEICEEGASPANCKTAAATVDVVNGLMANADNSFGSQTSGSTAVTVGSVTSNDTLNGAAVTSANTNVTPKTTGPLSVDADGELTLAANTASGTYTITYEICEEGASPANCKTAMTTVDVVNGLMANADNSFGAQTSGSTAVTVGNVTSNDTLNGAAVTTANTNVTPKTTGPLSVDADGELTLAANTASGTYTITYEICEEGASPANCKTAAATVDVVNGLMANADNSFGAQTSGSTAVTVGSVTSNDTLNGSAVTSANTNVTPKTTGPLSVDADGELTLAANTASGTYTITYEICEEGASPANCKTAAATVDVVNGLMANADNSFGAQTSGSTAVTVGNVTSNDTLNGAAVTTANTNVTPKTTGPLSVDADGELTLAANTASGTYTITYEICEEGASPANCKTAAATVDVVNGLMANADNSFGAQTSGSTAVTVGNVTSNDTLNGAAVTSANTNVTPKTTGPLSVDADGELTLAANTASGTYTITYEICEEGASPANCKTAAATVDVVNGLMANADNSFGAQTSGSTAVTVGSVTSNDTLNGAAVTSANTNVTPKTTGPLSVDADGELTLAANTASGTYTLTYEICEEGASPANCKTAAAAVDVVNGLMANADNSFGAQTSGSTAVTVGNVTSNDTLNGAAVTTANTNVTPKTTGPLSVDADGELTLAANTASGTYTITYEICEEGASPANCKTASGTVDVVNGLMANADNSFGAQTSGSTAVTVGNVTSNDTLNGAAVTSANTNVTPKTTGPLSVDADGELTLAANTASGTYTITYEICEEGASPANCKTAAATVDVVNGLMANADNSFGAQTSGSTAVTVGNVTSNDTLNGAAVTSANTNVTPKTTGPLSVDADGELTLAANTASGTYTLTYEICEEGASPANCKTAAATVDVVNNLVANIDIIGSVLASNTSQTLGVNVFTNDTKNGQSLNSADVNMTISVVDPNGYLTLDTDGSVILAANAPAGTYELTYEICEKPALSNCSSNIVRVIVDMPVIDAVTETTASINGNAGGTTPALTANDKLNGNPVVIGTNPGEVKLTAVNVPTGLTLNEDGTITVAPNTPAGTYDVEYSICEISNPLNCDAVISKVVVGLAIIDAVTETTASINGNAGGTTPALTANDTLNGNPVVIGTNPGEVKLTAVNVPTGLTLNSDGTVTVSPNTPAGTYDVEYSICEISNPLNCDTVISKVVVTTGTLVANADVIPSVKPSNVPQTLGGNVFDNDTKNGQPLNPSDVTLTTTTPDPKGVLILNPDGTITLGANPPAGTYELTYTICEKLNPGNCSSNTVRVTVDMPVIDAVAETLTPSINGSTGGTTTNSVIAGDTLNGVQAVIGTSAGQVKLTGINIPAGLTLNADGTVTVAPNTPSGIYDIEYSICEITNPANCDTAISKVAVNNGTLVANADVIPSVKPSNVPQTLGGNVFDNDTKNGQPLNPSDVTLTTTTPDPKGVLILNPDGTITLGANPPAGTYELTYTICEKLNPGNCSSNTVKVTVDMPVIDAVAETLTPSINGSTGGTTTNSVIAGDTLNGVQAVIGTSAGQVKLTGINIPAGLTLNADGTVTVAPNTPSGIYDIEYSICEITNPANCDTAISKVAVNNGTLVANADVIPSVKPSNVPQTLGGNVFDNDTKNGQPLNPSDVTLTTTTPDPKGVLILNPDGTITLGANPPAGTYELTYTICEKLNPGNCSSNTVRVTVDMPVIDAVAETLTPSINGSTGGTTTNSVIAGDTLNGVQAVIGTSAGQVKLTGINIPAGLTLNADGTVTVAPNTPSGIYDIEYSICEITNPANCDTAISKVAVNNGTLVANADVIPSVKPSNVPQTLGGNVFDNDTKNGQPLNPSDVTLTTTTPDPKGVLTLNPDGTITLGANPPAGTYELTYTICEKLNPGNCSSNTVRVTVDMPVIDAVAETLTPSINGSTGGTTTNSVIAGDTLNGVQAVIGTSAGQVKLTGINIPAGLTLNADGTVTVAPNTPSGIYDIEYSICEITNPANCDTAISKVAVNNGTLVANADVIPSVKPSNVPQTLGGNVFDNDTKNGQPLNPSDVTLTTTTPDPKGVLTLNPDGTITLGANPPAGTYELTYTICEKLNPGNCSSNTVKVTVDMPVIDAVAETLTPSINGSTGGTTTNSVIAGDTLNGVQAVIGTSAGQVKLTGINIPAGLTLNADGTVTVAPNTPSGIYDIEYSICEVTNPANCDTAISKVAVNNGTLVANADVIPSVKPSNVPQTLGGNVFDNDTKNGQPLNPSDVTLTKTTPDPKGVLILNPDGTITLGANPPAGTYELTYTICEKLNPGNCSSNTVRVTVDMPVIDAVAETLTPSINGSTGGTTTNSVIAGDTLNGVQAVIGTSAGQVKLTGINIPAGLTLNADGTVTVAPNTPSGIYDIEYSICEITNPANCDTAISKVAVNNGTLVANADVIPSVKPSNVPQTLGGNVFDNDTKNGQPLNPSDVTLTTATPDPKGVLILNPDGTITLGANPPAGTYELTYTICEKLNPGNCSSNTVKVTVDMPVIDAVAETLTPSINGSTGGTTTNSVIAGDTLNGVQAVIGTSAGQVKLTGINIPAGLTLNADGTVTVAPNTPSGIYDIEYSICEITNPANCDTAISKVIVTIPSGSTLQANADVIPSVVGTNQPKTIINVFDNDTNNGLPLVPSDVNLTIVTPDPTGFLTLNPDGTVTLGANAPRGTYEIVYQICEKANPGVCSSATVEIAVEEPTMTVTADSYCSNNVPYVNYNVVPDNFTPTDLLTIKWIDSTGKVVATQSGLQLSGTVLWPGAVVDANNNGTDWPGWIFANNQWTEGADGFENTKPAVTMEFSVNPTVSISVNYPLPSAQCNSRPTFVIKANDDNAGPIDRTKGSDAGINIFDNDTLNGSKVNPADVTLTTIDANAALTLNTDGTVTIKAGTQSGTYQLTYQICDALNSSSCSQAIVKVIVLNTVEPVNPPAVIEAVEDALVSVDGLNGDLEFVNVLDNDLLNSLPVNAADVVITNTSNNTNFEFNEDGTVNVKPNTPGGTYQISYSICEKAKPTNCSSAILNVFVEVPGIAIVKTAVFNDENNNKIANAGETITYKFVVTNTGNVPLKGVMISDPLPGVVVSGQAVDLAVGESNDTNFSALYKITQADINAGKVTNQASVKGSSARGVVVEDMSDGLDIDGDKPTVITLNGCEINVLNAFSPNGDNKNERFYIQGLECYPDNTVEIYNRWGVLVFEKEGYNNEDRVFKGYSEGRTTMKQSEGLPVGTYFYILKYKDSGSNPHQKSGYLYISK
ncbi:gliding motility-associated C-terminal domain-containing protein [Flavobacterium gelatinilyticum]|uniref:T9SS type B sorting domain-containing protein n=1 Tax=Flavobacterium gelatinilyticum TaxID=3003260 RepID=UPI0024801592|nr:gliding motility-associated C-terminal domain-containing protein [Flavobacterium gelatinilyticum]